MPQSSASEVHVGTHVEEKHAAAAARVLYPRERLLAIFSLTGAAPAVDCLLVTSARVLAVDSHRPASGTGAIRRAVDRREIRSVERRGNGRGKRRDAELVLRLRDGASVSIRSVREDDFVAIVRHLARPVDEALADELAAPPRPAVARRHAAAAEPRAAADRLAAVREVVVGRVGDRQAEEIAALCADGERPRFVIADPGSGALAAFDDRLAVVKTGARTSWLAGSIGGGGVATFAYADVTGVAYRQTRFAGGVLEILAAGAGGAAAAETEPARSRRGADGDPFARPDALPLSPGLHDRARPHLDELRRLIARAQRARVAAPGGVAGRSTLAGELAELARLHAEGFLDGDEFRTAKRAAIARHAAA